MSGYFQRLMNRGAGAETLIHPLSRLPYAAAPESEPLDDGGELATAPRAWERQQGDERAEGSAAVAAPEPDHGVLAALLRPPAPGMSSDATKEQSDAALLPEASPPLIRTVVLGEGIVSVPREAPSMPIAQAVEAQPAVSQQPPLKRVEEHPVNEVSESFRLMTPRILANAVAPFGSPPESRAGRVQATHASLKNRPSSYTLKNQPGMSAEPEVHVNIGRIEVTAVTEAPAQRRAAIPRKPAMSLDDYLARRQRREP
jgi:hypothetical protein